MANPSELQLRTSESSSISISKWSVSVICRASLWFKTVSPIFKDPEITKHKRRFLLFSIDMFYCFFEKNFLNENKHPGQSEISGIIRIRRIQFVEIHYLQHYQRFSVGHILVLLPFSRGITQI